MKVVINTCYGGFSLSPEAELWLFHKGFEEGRFKIPVEEYGRAQDEELERWREYQKDPKKKRDIFLTTFTPDEKFVLYGREIRRDHPLLVECVETLGEAAYGSCAKLQVIEIPDDVDWEVDEYDGLEKVHERHRSWS